MESNQTVSQRRMTGISCNDANLQQQVLLKHRITQAKFESMADDFFGGAAPGYREFPAQIIHDMIMDLDCNEFKLRLNADENDTQSNNEIDLAVEQVKRFDVHYSIVLFKAVLNTYNPTRIIFTKAISQDEYGTRRNDIVFAAMSGNTPVYYGDLSDLLP